MKYKKKVISGLAVALSVIMFSSNVVYATDGMDIQDAQPDSVIETVDNEVDVVEEADILEETIETELSEETGVIVEELSTEEYEVIAEEVLTEESSEEVIEESSEETQDEHAEEIEEEIAEEMEMVETDSSVENPYVWTSGDFQITHHVINDWGTGYQCEITITNIGDTAIEDWKLVLETEDTIDNIWNASVESAENGVYRIENLGWNANILPNGSVSFGYVASYEEELCVPTFYGVGGIEEELTDESYQVTYEVNNLWENGYVGNIVIHNLTDTDLRNWKITFDLSDIIVNLWNGNITGNENGQYTVQYASYNATIPAGGNVIIGFTAESDAPQVYPENYSVKVVVRNEMNTSSRDDVIGVAYFEPITEADIRIADDGIQYAVNQLNIVGNDGCTFEQIAALGEEYGFEIVGYIEFTNDYQIKFVNEKTYEELGELCDAFETLDYILEANYNMVSTITNNSAEDEISLVDGYLPNDEKWVDYWSEYYVLGNWGVKAINAPQAWEYQEYMSPVKIGVYDNMFMPHEDLTYEKIWNFYNYSEGSDVQADNHGTSVAGVMSAGFDNGIGIAGVACEHELYAYAYDANIGSVDESVTGTIMEFKYALALMIGNGVRVLNFSNAIEQNITFAASGRISNNEASERARNYISKYTGVLESFLERLLIRGYDFVIIQSAGNDNNDYFVEDNSKYGCYKIAMDKYGNLLETINENALTGGVSAKYNSFFSFSDELANRIIVVGAYGCHNNEFYMSNFSNVGSRVDVVAPGENIESTVPYNRYDNELSGTSYAAPFVSGIAALVYSVNPELSGIQVKEIIVGTATQTLPGIESYQENQSGLGLTVPADNHVYKCVDAGAAVERALEESGNTPTLGENTGFIMGNIVCETDIEGENEIAKGVEISAYRYSTYDGNVDMDYQYTTVSDAEGFFDLCVDPGMYQVTIYKEGYIPLIIERVQVLEGRVKYLDPILQIREFSFRQNYEITGRVVDALNASAIADANIVFREGWNKTEGETIDETAITDNNGMYTVTLKRGYYTAAISKDGYNTGYVNIVVYADMTIQEAVLSPYLQENEMRIVLTWGDSPSDLDSHMYIANGYTNYHVYYGNRTVNIGGSDVTCNLDRDDTTSYGPETITLFLDDSTVNCKYSVYRYSSSGSLPLSGARVVVYYGSNEPVTFNVPVQGDGRTWDVFAVENGEIIPINTLY